MLLLLIMCIVLFFFPKYLYLMNLFFYGYAVWLIMSGDISVLTIAALILNGLALFSWAKKAEVKNDK